MSFVFEVPESMKKGDNHKVNTLGKMIKILIDRDYRFIVSGRHGFHNNIPDEEYLKKMYKSIFRKELNLNCPKTYNEKIQWLKLYDRRPVYNMIQDKYEAKAYAAQLIGEKYIIPTYGVWDRFEDINFDELPNKFVLKCTHDCRSYILCNNKGFLDKRKAKKLLSKHLSKNFYYKYREWAYKDIKPRIIAEYLLEPEDGDLKDYKFFCFDGVVKALCITSGREEAEGLCIDYFDANFKRIVMQWGYPNSGKTFEKPAKFDEMKKIASQLSKGFATLRVDLYLVKGDIFLGELTAYDGGGFVKIEPYEMDVQFGAWIQLPNVI